MPRKYLSTITKNAIHLTLFGLMGAFMVFLACYLYVSPQLPRVETIKEFKLQTPMSVYTADGELVANFGEKKRIPLSFEEIPDTLNQALIATEDRRFYKHGGVDVIGLTRAVYELVTTASIGGGGSTITMQLARNYFLSFTQTFTRKTKEIFLSWKIERALSKQEILTLYWNKIDFSYRANGIGAAAQVYYGTTVDQLTLPQLAVLAGIPKGPTTHNPLANPDKAFNRRNHVLRRMYIEGYIDEPTYEQAVATPLTASYHGSRVTAAAPYLAEMVRSEMIQRFGIEDAYTKGYRVYTTLDSKLQSAGRQSLRDALIDYDRRHGYRGAERNFVEVADFALGLVAPTQDLTDNQATIPPLTEQLALMDIDLLDDILNDFRVIGELRPALVLEIKEQAVTVLLRRLDRNQPLAERVITINWDGLSWARPFINENRRGPRPRTASNILASGDLIRTYQDKDGTWQLGQLPNVKSAFVALRPDDGAIVTLVGGFDFNLSKFNNVTQAERQLGSNIKPFIYSAALEKGYTAASVVNDAPFTKVDPSNENIWRPKNSSGNYKGPTRLRRALSSSTNLVSIRLVNDITPEFAVDYLANLGFERSRLPSVASIALGSPSFSPLELATGYAIFANGGYRVEPYFISRIEDSNGNVIYEHQPVEVCEACLEERDSQTGTNDLALSTLDQYEQQRQRAEDSLLAEIAEEQAELNEQELMFATETQQVETQDAASYLNLDADIVLWPESIIPEQLIAKRVIPADNIYIMDSMMRDVIKVGTAAPRLRASNSSLLKRNDLAGKTGTTNDAKDAWFSGYNGDYVATAWVGNQRYTDPGLGNNEFGGKAALPIWQGFMEVALNGKPDHSVDQPEGIITAKIDPKTGLLAPAGMRNAIFEVFREAYMPTEFASDPIADPFKSEQKKQTDIF
jgi:penicillin-binding protein 1A